MHYELSTVYLTIIRRRRSEYWWIFPEKKSSWLFSIIIHQIFLRARVWPKSVTWPNIPQLKLGNILVAHSFSRASLSENCSLLGTDNVRGQISKHIFAPNGDYCLYIHEPEENNCLGRITQVIIEIPKQRNVKFYYNLPLLIRAPNTTLLVSMCRPMPFSFRARKLKHFLWRSYSLAKTNWNVVYRGLYSSRQRVRVIILFPNNFFFSFRFCMLNEFTKVL